VGAGVGVAGAGVAGAGVAGVGVTGAGAAGLGTGCDPVVGGGCVSPAVGGRRGVDLLGSGVDPPVLPWLTGAATGPLAAG
jgi:ATP-binding cassette subfamily B protein